LSYAFSILEAELISQESTDVAVSQVKLSSFITSLLLFMMILIYHEYSRGTYMKIKIFKFAGINSYFIYLSHLKILGKVSSIMSRCQLLNELQWLFVPCVILITFAVCLLISFIIRKIIPRKLAPIIGL
jgi:hypothetical protein